MLIVRSAAAWLRTARCLQRGDQLITIIGRRRGNQQPDTAADQTVVGVSPTLSLILTQVVHYLASFVQQNSKIGGHSNPFGGSSITYVGSVCHQSRVIWSWGAHSALTSWSRWFYTVKWSKLAIFSGLSGRFLGVVWWFQSFLQVRTCLYLDDQVKFWKKI